MRTLLLGMYLALMGFGCAANHPAEDQTTPDRSCERHGTKLLVDTVQIYYGYPAIDQRREDDRARNFPNAKSSVWGGGCVVDESRQWAKVSYCPACRKAEAIQLKKEM